MKKSKYTVKQINELAKQAILDAEKTLTDKKLREMFPIKNDGSESEEEYVRRLKLERFYYFNGVYSKKYDELKDL